MATVAPILNAQTSPSRRGHLTTTMQSDPTNQKAGVLSNENHDLVRQMRNRPPRTVLELEPAKWPGRPPSNLSRTLRNLECYGLVRLKRSSETQALRP